MYQSPSEDKAQARERKAITKRDLVDKNKSQLASTSYFKTEDKLNDKFDYRAWKMTLDLTLEEREVLDYVQGKVVEPPSNAPTAVKTKS